MRLSRYFLPVLKETPAEAQIVSHRLMLRAGMVKQASAGIYSWLPLGYKVLRRVEQISGVSIPAIEGDVNDAALLDSIFASHTIDAVIHFAGLKAVGESVRQPLRYYENNVSGTVILCAAMQRAAVDW